MAETIKQDKIQEEKELSPQQKVERYKAQMKGEISVLKIEAEHTDLMLKIAENRFRYEQIMNALRHKAAEQKTDKVEDENPNQDPTEQIL